MADYGPEQETDYTVGPRMERAMVARDPEMTPMQEALNGLHNVASMIEDQVAGLRQSLHMALIERDEKVGVPVEGVATMASKNTQSLRAVTDRLSAITGQLMELRSALDV